MQTNAYVCGEARVRPWAGGERHNYVVVDAEFLSGRRINHDP
jgi:hypothetical protein